MSTQDDVTVCTRRWFTLASKLPTDPKGGLYTINRPTIKHLPILAVFSSPGSAAGHACYRYTLSDLERFPACSATKVKENTQSNAFYRSLFQQQSLYVQLYPSSVD
ncbi:MAG: hypothetical protein KUG67_01680 [Proteobacteria bacterium]|nr:hypothetical protein [Pseudomonadota bacterium]